MKTMIVLVCLGLMGLVSGARADDSTTLKSKDGTLQLVLPAGWVVANDLNDQADIQAKNPDAGTFVVCLADPKADLADTFDEYAKGRLKLLQKALTDAKVDGPDKKQIGGSDAIQYVVQGVLSGEDKIKVAYVLTVIQTKKYFVQVLAWTTASHFDDAKNELSKIAEQVTQVK